MFDDQPIQSGGAVPSNLPIAEPEDIFSGSDDAPAAPPVEAAVPAMADAMPAPQSALSMGALKPKPLAMSPMPKPEPRMITPPPVDGTPRQMPDTTPYPTKGPVLGRILITLLLILIIGGVVGGAAWFVYSKFVRGSQGKTPDTKQTLPSVVPPTPIPSPTQVAPPTPAVSSDSNTADSKLLFGEPVDTDSDGLTDDREQQLGTDPANWDTDHDGLSDYDEVTIWKTDPKNPDTDGDGYQDGAEVKNGYNPAGPGKIFEPPTPHT